MDTSKAQPQDYSPHPYVTQEQRLSAPQQGNIDQDDMARLPRMPVIGNDRVPTMTLQELWDWRAGWHAKRRPPTKSERLDYDECARQIDDLASETDIDWEEFDKKEREMDTCPSPTQRDHPAWTEDYQLRRELHKDEIRREQRREQRKQRKRLLSPPRTPPHLRGAGLYQQQHAGLVPQGGSSRIKKGKRDNRKAPRRPITRSTSTPDISLHDRKGYVKFWNTMTQYVVISYEKYLRDYDREELDKRPWEPVDFSHEDPKYPHKTDYQRELEGTQVKWIKISSWMAKRLSNIVKPYRLHLVEAREYLRRG